MSTQSSGGPAERIREPMLMNLFGVFNERDPDRRAQAISRQLHGGRLGSSRVLGGGNQHTVGGGDRSPQPRHRRIRRLDVEVGIVRPAWIRYTRDRR